MGTKGPPIGSPLVHLLPFHTRATTQCSSNAIVVLSDARIQTLSGVETFVKAIFPNEVYKPMWLGDKSLSVYLRSVASVR